MVHADHTARFALRVLRLLRMVHAKITRFDNSGLVLSQAVQRRLRVPDRLRTEYSSATATH